MNLNKISSAVKAALAKPDTFATDRGVEIEQRGGYKEILISFKGLKTLLEQEGETVAASPVVATPAAVVTTQPFESGEIVTQTTTEVVVTTTETPTEVVTEPAKTEVAVEDQVVEQKAPEPEVSAPVPTPAPKAKPGPKPKAPTAA